MAKVFIFYQPGNEHHPNWTYCLPGEDEALMFRLRAEAAKTDGHVHFVVDHDGAAHEMHLGHARAHVAKHQA